MQTDHYHQFNRITTPALILLAVILVIFVISYGSGRSLWLDEAYSVYVSNQAPESIIEELKVDSHPPLYFLLLAGWIRLFGEGEYACRALSALFYLLGMGAFYFLAKFWFADQKAGLLCALLFLTAKPAMAHAQIVRMYTLLVCLAALSTLCFVRCFWNDKECGFGWKLACILINIAGSFSHYWFFFVVAAQGAVWIICLRGIKMKSYIFSLTASFVPFSILWAPFLIRYQLSGKTVKSLEAPGPEDIGLTLLDYYGGGISGSLILGTMVILIFWGYQEKKFSIRKTLSLWLNDRRIRACILMLTVMLCVPWLISQSQPVYRIGLYTIIGLVPLVLIAGYGLRFFVHPVLLRIFLLGLLSGSLFFFIRHRNRLPDFDERETARMILEQTADNDIIIFTGLSRLPMEYYFRQLAPQKRFLKFYFPVEQLEHPGWRDTDDYFNRKDQLKREAEEVVNTIYNLQKPQQRLFVLWGDNRITSILGNVIDDRLQKQSTIELPGDNYSFSSIRIYQSAIGEKSGQ